MSELNSVKNDMTMAQENAALRSRVAVLEEELAFVLDQLTWLKKQVFGRKTEQSSVILDNCTQLSLFPEKEKLDTVDKSEAVTVPEHKRRKKRTHDDWMETMHIEVVKHKEEPPVCENCGSEMKEIGQEKAYDELVYTPAKFHVRRHIVYTYKCPECGDNPENDAYHTDNIELCIIRRAAAAHRN